MEVYILELTSEEDLTGVEFNNIIGVFDTKQKAIDFMNSESKSAGVKVTENELGFFNCSKPISLDSSHFTITSHIVK